MAVWKGGRWYVRRRYLPARVSRWRRRALAVTVVAALAALVFARARRRALPEPTPVVGEPTPAS
jgi:hypothetical protein